MAKNKLRRPASSFFESLESRRLLSHSTFATRLTFTSTQASGSFGNAIQYPVAVKVTAAGLPLRGATIEVKDSFGNIDAEGVTGRSGYMTAVIPQFFPGTTPLTAYFAGTTRYIKSQSRTITTTISVPTGTPTETADGSTYWVTKQGTGSAEVENGDTVTAEYNGYLDSNGGLFNTTVGQSQAFSFQLGVTGLIDGFAEGVVGMKVGEIRTLLVPAAEAYGDNPPSGSGIPDNAELVFEIQVDSITPA
jgi:hypothetical protein